MKIKGQILSCAEIANTFRRLAFEIIEKQGGVENLVLIGIKTRGVPTAKRIVAELEKIENVKIPVGSFDITLHRDDLENFDGDAKVLGSEIDFDITGKDVLLCDDVIYTARTVRAAISLLLELGRPKSIRFLALIDRGHRELPFKADFTGKSVPSSRREGISVKYVETDGEDAVYIYDKE